MDFKSKNEGGDGAPRYAGPKITPIATMREMRNVQLMVLLQ